MTARKTIPQLKVGAITDAPRSETPLCFTQAALDEALASVGLRAPEAGAKLFGPALAFGTDTVEFDQEGSAAASGAAYSPDAKWGQQRVDFWLAQRPQRAWVGDLHSHPGASGRPSSRLGPADGDMGYVAAVFDAFHSMEYFCLPILTGAGPRSDEVTLWPWLAHRVPSGVELLAAELKVCEAHEFPPRAFNPNWKSPPPEASSGHGIDESALARMIEGEVVVRSSGLAWQVHALKRGVILTAELPVGFPEAPPRVLLPTLDGVRREAPVSWKRDAKESVEERLAKLINTTVHWLARTS
jgi:hypothetical protein